MVKMCIFNFVKCWSYLLLILTFTQISSAFASCKPILSPSEFGTDWHLSGQIEYADKRLGYGLEFLRRGPNSRCIVLT